MGEFQKCCFQCSYMLHCRTKDWSCYLLGKATRYCKVWISKREWEWRKILKNDDRVPLQPLPSEVRLTPLSHFRVNTRSVLWRKRARLFRKVISIKELFK